MTLEENIDIIKWAYFEDNDVFSIHDYTIQYFPGLSNLDKNLSRDDIYKIIEEEVTQKYKKNIENIIVETKLYNDLWQNYNDKYFKALSIFLDVDWPNNINEIVGTVGLIPVFPRNLDNFSFSVSPKISELQLIEICAHETLHFLWFEKWKQMYPETPRREYDSPYLVWQYSEMVTDPILNNKPFREMFAFIEHGYDSFYDLKDDNINVMDNLRNIYSNDITVEEKINIGFEYIYKYFNEKDKAKTTKK